MSLQQIAIQQKNAIQFYGSQDRYDKHKHAKVWSSKLYKQDFDIYMDTWQQRYQRNAKELKHLIELIRSDKFDPTLAEFNSASCFFPSYVLNHHLQHFTKIVEDCGSSDMIAKCRKLELIGAVFDKVIETEFQKTSRI